jgi:hypothetical protein
MKNINFNFFNRAIPNFSDNFKKGLESSDLENEIKAMVTPAKSEAI